jgi:zinc protease
MTTLAHRGLSPVRRTLPAGGTVLVQQTATHPAATLYATVAAGSGFDPAPLLGLANFTARVMDRGTETRSAERLAEELDGRGVSLNTGASRHLLTLSCTCLSEDIPAMLDIMADVLRRPVFPTEQVERRRTTITTAIRQDQDNPAAVAVERLMAMLYPDGHPYGRPSRGRLDTVERIARQDLIAFHQAHVGPSSLRVVVVGDVEPVRAVDAVEQAFGDWNASSGAPLQPPHAKRASGRTAFTDVVPGKAQSDVAYGFTALARSDPRYYALLLMNNILGQYALGGRLGDNIRERQGMAYYVFSSFDGNVVEGPLVIRAGVSPSNVERTVRAIDLEVDGIARDGVTSQELADAQRYLVGSMPRVLETNGGIASFLHDADYFGLGDDFDQRLPILLGAVSLDEVNAIARDLLSSDRAAVAIAGPAAAEGAGPAA